MKGDPDNISDNSAESHLELNEGSLAEWIPDHELIRCIGSGSYGEVWLARNLMGTFRAVKIISAKNFQNGRPVEREWAGLREFEPVSRTHDGFVDILQIGQNQREGYSYYVMELGDDEQLGTEIDPDRYRPKTLASEISHLGRLPVSACVDLGLSLSNSLRYLHQQGLIHRDVKPSNVIFVGGVPKLADIGLVASIREARSYVGTEGFIPPEGPGKPQADIYSLGKLLYECCTGKDRTEFPTLPLGFEESATSNDLLELNEVILKACHTDVRNRYQSADDLFSDLQLLKVGKSVRRLRFLERRLAKLKKNGVVGGVVLLLMFAIYAPIAAHRRQQNNLLHQQLGTLIAEGTSAMEEGNLLEALSRFVAAMNLDHKVAADAESHRLRVESVFEQCPKLVQMWFGNQRQDDAEFSQDGRWILTGQYFGKAQVWDSVNGQALSLPFGPSYGLRTASFSPDGSLVLTASEDKTARVYKLQTGESPFPYLPPYPHPKPVLCARFSPDRKTIATACTDGKVRLWQLATNRPPLELDHHKGYVLGLNFSRDGKRLLTAGADGTALIWDLGSKKLLGRPMKHKNWVYSAAFSPDNKEVVTASFDRTLRVWDVETSREKFSMSHDDGVSNAEFSPDGRLILSAGLDRTVRLWDATTGRPFAPFPILWHSDRVMQAHFAPDGHRIVSVCVDGTVRIWDLAGSSALATPIEGRLASKGRYFVTAHGHSINVQSTTPSGGRFPTVFSTPQADDALLSENGKFLATISTPLSGTNQRSREFQLWNLSAKNTLIGRYRTSQVVSNLVLSNDGTCLAMAFGHSIAVVHFQSGRAQVITIPLDHSVKALVFSPNSDGLASISHQNVAMWDSATGRLLFPLLKHAIDVSYVAFSPDGSSLVTCTQDATFKPCEARIWNVRTGKSVGLPLPHRDGVIYAAFSPDSKKIVTASEEFTAEVWDVRTGRQMTPPLKHRDKVLEAAFSHDGRWIVTVCEDHSVRIWNAETGRPLSPPLPHARSISHARFIQDDRRIIAASKNGYGWIWDIQPRQIPSDDWTRLSDLLVTSSFKGSWMPTASSLKPIQSNWHRLQDNRPGLVAILPEEVRWWHRTMAESCEAANLWAGAVSHWQFLLNEHPDQPEVAQRLELARQHLRDGFE
jgi:eukaryotic-like serine/threonine-protein kinase